MLWLCTSRKVPDRALVLRDQCTDVGTRVLASCKGVSSLWPQAPWVEPLNDWLQWLAAAPDRGSCGKAIASLAPQVLLQGGSLSSEGRPHSSLGLQKDKCGWSGVSGHCLWFWEWLGSLFSGRNWPKVGEFSTP